MEPERIFIKTDLFAIEPKEDEETNPFVYGKQFSEWLRSRFIGLGYEVEEVIPEDWGLVRYVQTRTLLVMGRLL
ncbi:hypothetical protein [Teredinibacter waterburyi]|uniref:hypothetical protein n=1 Tax=Teredinibacter waterburyi TaxID=1500538 RepID=UPI00165EFA52|nr:hypothetical protein [Teredinibacter waterburyi]